METSCLKCKKDYNISCDGNVVVKYIFNGSDEEITEYLCWEHAQAIVNSFIHWPTRFIKITLQDKYLTTVYSGEL